MPNNLRHDLDGATPEEQAIHLALQREIEMDLTGYATKQWVKSQQYIQKPTNLLGNTPPAPEPQPDIDLDGYATTEYVDEKTQGVEDASVVRDELLNNKIEDEVKGNTAPRLPGFTWNYKAYADEANKAPVTPGEFTWNKEDSTFYISCTSACGILLGNQQSSFAPFVTQAVMTIYEQGMVLRALAQVIVIELKSYAGQHYFQIVRGGYARQTLNAGKSYNITLSGVF